MTSFTCFKTYDIQGQSLTQLLDERTAAYPCSGEINFRVNDIKVMIQLPLTHCAEQRPKLDTNDGISLEFADLRMSLRASNTEPLLQLSIEARADSALVAEQVDTIDSVVREMSETEQVRVL